MTVASPKEVLRRRAARVRRSLRKVAGDRPRLSVFRSDKHIYAQIIDDGAGATIVAACSLDADVKAAGAKGSDTEGAIVVGRLIAERAKAKGLAQVVFDRGGYRYHGRIKALADAAREAGLDF